jgi:rRNA maturation RNase YbeY
VIRFFVGEGGVGLQEKRQVRAWLQEVLSHAGVRKADLNYIFCGDEYLYQLNLEYLGHDTYTDIITFPGSSGDIAKEKSISGECYISTDRIADNASQLGVSYVEELHRVMAHGILHLLGFGDKSVEEASKMREEENAALLMRKFHVEQSAFMPVNGTPPSKKGGVSKVESGGGAKERASELFHVEQIMFIEDVVNVSADGG